MDDCFRDLIRNNIDKIDNNDFSGLYQCMQTIGQMGELTSLLMSVGIDPFIHLNGYIQEYMFSFMDIDTISIPSTVLKIGKNAFYRSTVRTLILPSSVKYIAEYAFNKCEHLTTIIFNESSNYFLKNVKRASRRWKSGSAITQVVCTDKTIYV